MSFYRFYNEAYKRMPLLIHAVETGIIMAGGDVAAQTLVEKKQLTSVDLFRSLRFGALGICIIAPARVAWYKFLERKFPGTSFKIIAQKVVIDQLCFAPCIVCVVITSVGYANGMQPPEVLLKLQSSYTEILVNNWKLWPAVQVCNFTLVPPHLRMTFVQFVALLWNIYMSWKTNASIATSKQCPRPIEPFQHSS